MANVYAVSAGNWSVAARWNTGALPTAADDVYANGFAVTIDQDITVVSLQTRSNTGIAAGGSFTASSTRTINASIYAGTTTCLTLSGTSFTFTVNAPTVQGSNTSTGSINGISITAVTSTINIVSTTITGASGSTAGNSSTITCLGTSNTVSITATTISGGTSTGNSNFGINFGMSTGTHSVTVNATSLTAGAIGTTQYAITFSNSAPCTYNVSGNTTASGTSIGLNLNASAATTINLTGNVTGGTASSNLYGINVGGSLTTLNLIGNVTAGSGGSTAHGIYSNANVTVNITGNVTGGIGSANGVYNASIGTINITGNATAYNATAGYGASNNSTGTVIIDGTVTASVTDSGARNVSTGTLRVKTAQASTGAAGLIGSNAGGITTFESAIFASNGFSPFSGFCKLKAGTNNYITCQKESGTLTLIDSANVSNGLPAASDVRLGTAFNFGNTTGTLAVPTASQVSSGIAVDNTTGTAVLTAANVKASVWDIAASTLTTSNSIGERAKNMATTQDVGNLITSLI